MGVSTDAILCYGFCIKDEDGEEAVNEVYWLGDDDQMEFEDFLAKLIGLEKPYDSCDEERYDEDPDYQDAWRSYGRKKRKLEEEIGVTLVAHCSDEYTMYILAATESVQTASRGYPIKLGQSIIAKAEWRDKIHSFCERAGIEFEEPQFIQCSYWVGSR